MVPCGSSPVARLYPAKNEAHEEEAAVVHWQFLTTRQFVRTLFKIWTALISSCLDSCGQKPYPERKRLYRNLSSRTLFITNDCSWYLLLNVHCPYSQAQFKNVPWDANSIVVFRVYIQPGDSSASGNSTAQTGNIVDESKLAAWTAVPLALTAGSHVSRQSRQSGGIWVNICFVFVFDFFFWWFAENKRKQNK